MLNSNDRIANGQTGTNLSELRAANHAGEPSGATGGNHSSAAGVSDAGTPQDSPESGARTRPQGENAATKFKLRDRVIDRGGFKGTIVLVTEWRGSVWYDVRFERGSAVRYDSDLTLQEVSL
jgi:hypothetical protein